MRQQALEDFYLAIHALWDAQGAIGRANSRKGRNLLAEERQALDWALAQAMRRVERADEAVKRAG